MSELTAQRVEYRRVLHAEGVSIVDGDEVFMALSTPPPVRTRLRVVIGEDDVRGFEVVRVREVESEERGRGAFGRWIDADQTGVGMPVGSEQFEGPQPAAPVQPEPEADSAPEASAEASEGTLSAEASAPQAEESAEAAETAAEATADAGEETPADASEGDAESSDDGGAGRSRRGKKRKGRKRG